jgi:beta-ribofuranosylaminobenzene 5'-phosphate synthase
MLGVQAYSRLHFGVLRLGEASAPPTRWFGGVGLMIERPSLHLEVKPASSWSAEGPQAARVLALAQRFVESTRQEENRSYLSPRFLRLTCALPEHVGLGSGTQLALSVARVLAESWELSCDLPTLARRMGRGQRSALGVHGFEQGGLLVEAGKRFADQLAPLVTRLPFPESWRLVLILPSSAKANSGLHGRAETEAFARLSLVPDVPGRTDALCRLVLLGLLPALVERDSEAFGAALHEFNARVGEAFAPVQGGSYATKRVAEIVSFVRREGVPGVGQSSWGPTVFAVVADEDRAAHLAARLRQQFTLDEASVRITPACNHSAKLTTDKHR